MDSVLVDDMLNGVFVGVRVDGFSGAGVGRLDFGEVRDADRDQRADEHKRTLFLSQKLATQITPSPPSA